MSYIANLAKKKWGDAAEHELDSMLGSIGSTMENLSMDDAKWTIDRLLGK